MRKVRERDDSGARVSAFSLLYSPLLNMLPYVFPTVQRGTENQKSMSSLYFFPLLFDAHHPKAFKCGTIVRTDLEIDLGDVDNLLRDWAYRHEQTPPSTHDEPLRCVMVDGRFYHYLLIDHNFKLISTALSYVDVSAETRIAKLKSMVKENIVLTI